MVFGFYINRVGWNILNLLSVFVANRPYSGYVLNIVDRCEQFSKNKVFNVYYK